MKELFPQKAIPTTKTPIERAGARVAKAEARTERAEMRTEEAKNRTESAEIRAEHAESRTESAKTRTEHAETRAEQAETRAEQAEADLVMMVHKGAADPPIRTLPAFDGDDLQALGKLTPRQREVLQHIAAGWNTKQIGSLLGLSPKTVEYHRLRLMEGLNVHDIAGLVRFALRVGLVSPQG